VNQAGITAVQAGDMIGADTLMQAAERVMVGNVNTNTTKERERDRRIIAIHEWGHFLVDFELERKRAGGDWEKIQAEMKTIKISLKANPRNNALGFVFHKQGANLLKTKGDIEHDVRVLLAAWQTKSSSSAKKAPPTAPTTTSPASPSCCTTPWARWACTARRA
jgi:cell division protease FtsH